jgi:hypothetical protein
MTTVAAVDLLNAGALEREGPLGEQLPRPEHGAGASVDGIEDCFRHRIDRGG